MQPNLLTAVKNILDFRDNDLKEYSSTYLIRINAIGEQLEFYLKDAFAGSFSLKQGEKEEKYQSIFSYLGNQNNPPDMILNKGDAFEIKKVGSPNSALALNSSPPKDRLYSADSRILESCKACDGGNWKEKDLFYVIGYVKEGMVKHLFVVHGRCYAADKRVYERINDLIKTGVDSVLDELNLEAGKTNELGKVRRVDPLGITELRIRGMWSIQNPVKVFSGICPIDASKEFSAVILMSKEKYESFPKSDREMLEADARAKVLDVKVKDPNNPAKAIEAKIIIAGW